MRRQDTLALLGAGLLLAAGSGQGPLPAPVDDNPAVHACLFVSEHLMACPDYLPALQHDCIGRAAVACQADRSCLLEGTEACLEGLGNHWPYEEVHPPRPGLDGDCTIAETWKRTVLSKDVTGCPGEFHSTDEGFQCWLFLPNGRRIIWNMLDETEGFIDVRDDPQAPGPSRMIGLSFHYRTDVPSAHLWQDFADGSRRATSFCD